MTSPNELALAAIGWKLIEDRVKARRAEIAAQLAEAIDPGDSKRPMVDGLQVGTVAYTLGKASHSAAIVDEDALVTWLLANDYADCVEMRVTDAWKQRLLSQSQTSGMPVGPQGEAEVPGIVVNTTRSAPYVSVRPDKKHAVVLFQQLLNQAATLALPTEIEEPADA